ncbi:BTAD domain-containing putative transcriptional regulator [Microbispora sp. NPDC049125]|uniref:AfsR/SARP family transcriptional regulator n=1 Tax=Microbispora sp. NPDC049125 TaxID=3154929 RepID=UPI0034655992
MDGDRRIAVRGMRQRTLLAALCVNAGRPVSKEQLLDELWDGKPLSNVDNALHALVARLRRVLNDAYGEQFAKERLITLPTGYMLKARDEEVDALLFDKLVAQAHEVLGTDPVRGVELLGQALALADGPALDDVGGGPALRSAALHYEELRLTAIEDKIAAGISAGAERGTISELKRMAVLHPWRERVSELLMLSLYRAGRQVEALDVYNQIRRRLTEELGVEPSPVLRMRMQSILNQDPALQESTVLTAVPHR